MRLYSLKFAIMFSLIVLGLVRIVLPSVGCDSDPVVEASRGDLLNYYNTQTMTHGGYMIALVIGGLTLISRWKEFAGGKGKTWWKFYIRGRWIIFIFIISSIIGLGIYLIGRTLWWGYLASKVIDVTPDEERIDERNIMIELHLKSGNAVRNCTESLMVRWAIECQSDLLIRARLVLAVFGVTMAILFLLSSWAGPLNPAFQLRQQDEERTERV